MKYNHIKMFEDFEQQEYQDETFVKTIDLEDEKLNLHKVAKNPMKVQFYLETIDGELYIDLNKILPDNMLIDAVWVKVGGEEERIADMLNDILSKTDKKTKSGFNTYVMYEIKQE